MRRRVSLNDKSAWRKAKFVDGKTVPSTFLPARERLDCRSRRQADRRAIGR
jgi:hypothetical protein